MFPYVVSVLIPICHAQGPDRDGGDSLPAVTEGEPSGQSPEASADRSFISVRNLWGPCLTRLCLSSMHA